MLVSQELIRVAILWHELWHERLEEASRLYFAEHNPEGMISALDPLHDLLEQGPTTARETSFAQVFGRELAEARESCRRYRRYGEIKDLDAAWELYFAVSLVFVYLSIKSGSSLAIGLQEGREAIASADYTGPPVRLPCAAAGPKPRARRAR